MDLVSLAKILKLENQLYIPATNLIKNGGFSEQSNGLATYFQPSSGAANNNLRVKNNAQYWNAQGQNTYSSSFRTNEYIKLKKGHMYYFRLDQTNLSRVKYRSGGVISFITMEKDGAQSQTFESEMDSNNARLEFYSRSSGDCSISYVFLVDLTETFGKGNELSKEQMDALLSQFTNSWFDSTQNMFNAQSFIKMYFDKVKQLENAIIANGGSV